MGLIWKIEYGSGHMEFSYRRIHVLRHAVIMGAIKRLKEMLKNNKKERKTDKKKKNTKRMEVISELERCIQYLSGWISTKDGSNTKNKKRKRIDPFSLDGFISMMAKTGSMPNYHNIPDDPKDLDTSLSKFGILGLYSFCIDMKKFGHNLMPFMCRFFIRVSDYVEPDFQEEVKRIRDFLVKAKENKQTIAISG